MPAKKTPLSISQHRKFGILLKKMRDDLLLQVLPKLDESYPKNSHVVKFAERSAAAIDGLRSELENALYAEATREELSLEGLNDVYFPHGNQPESKG